ncbi:MAG: hypothetical protein M3O22_06195, partial [Pseudomonadota bacterium]|nr:hypothetical protein [Pseudomonadota bacterium]
FTTALNAVLHEASHLVDRHQGVAGPTKQIPYHQNPAEKRARAFAAEVTAAVMEMLRHNTVQAAPAPRA